MASAQHLLDQVHSLANLAALEAAPGSHAERLAAELPAATSLADLEAGELMLVSALRQIDTMIARAMRLRIDHALATDTSIGAPTRSVFAQTVVNYVHDLPLLARRAHDVAARGGATAPDQVAEVVVAAAAAALALREVLLTGVLALIRDRAVAALPVARRHARDRNAPEPERRRWSAARRDLEALAVDPTRVLAAALATRLAAAPDELDEPEPEIVPEIADLLELD